MPEATNRHKLPVQNCLASLLYYVEEAIDQVRRIEKARRLNWSQPPTSVPTALLRPSTDYWTEIVPHHGIWIPGPRGRHTVVMEFAPEECAADMPWARRDTLALDRPLPPGA